jgi:5-methylcytosine-specific restriction endonuclease McrA
LRKPTYKYKPGESGFQTLFRKYQKSARERRYQFALTEDEFRALTQDNCHYCGLAPQKLSTVRNASETAKDRSSYLYNGVDRKDPTRGYEPDNCVPACSQCNLAKQSLTHDEFLALVSRIYQHTA